MNNENFVRQLYKVKVTVNLNSIGLKYNIGILSLQLGFLSLAMNFLVQRLWFLVEIS